ncbi:MAG: HEAT repeat domain-containing protein [Chloroflexi bacterium]|nr:HEAT repeat domain-containing protein [Chloroflexota bacterium]
MASRNLFKSDVSFLEKISMGATGTHRVHENLKNQGHNPIELERGSTSFKIWKMKIKRLRVPDILCVSCGRRIESRAKRTLELSMSHSLSDPERGWDYGLSDADLVAFVVCTRSGDRPIDWEADTLVQYVRVKELRDAQSRGFTVVSDQKGVQEGFETRITWPAAIAKSNGVVQLVTPDRVQYRRLRDNRIISLSLIRRGVKLTPFVELGDHVVENRVLASIVPASEEFPCPGGTANDYYLGRLSSSSLSERYAAAKALSAFWSEDVSRALSRALQETSEHIYVKLEAAANLARRNVSQGWSFIERCLQDEYLHNRLEAVITLAEIRADKSCSILTGVLVDRKQHPEIRAGSAWALGELRSESSLDALIECFAAVEEDIRIEAARALAKLGRRFTPEILQRFSHTSPQSRPGIAWALGKTGKFRVEDLLELLVDEDSRHWVAYVIGSQSERRYLSEIERLKDQDPELYFAVTLLWKITSSWVYELEEY